MKIKYCNCKEWKKRSRFIDPSVCTYCVFCGTKLLVESNNKETYENIKAANKE